MRLKSIRIDRSGWCNMDSPLVGEIEFEGDAGTIKLNLDEPFAKRVIELCADALVNSATDAAMNMTKIIEDAGGLVGIPDRVNDE